MNFDRFGHNFDPKNEADLRFIDRVAERDDALIESGEIKPTHMLAALKRGAGRAESINILPRNFAFDGRKRGETQAWSQPDTITGNRGISHSDYDAIGDLRCVINIKGTSFHICSASCE